MKLFIGIDQSINSTGVTVQLFDAELKLENFYIITGKDKLTAREQKAQDAYSNFKYIPYEKFDIKSAKDNHEAELFKTYNLSRISDVVVSIVRSFANNKNPDEIYVCMEGISYQSANTSSIMELAGLNYLIRYKLLNTFQSYKFDLIVAPPGEIKKYASGNGSAKKEVMVQLFEASHPNLYLIPKIDDIADSYWMCEYVKYLKCKDTIDNIKIDGNIVTVKWPENKKEYFIPKRKK